MKLGELVTADRVELGLRVASKAGLLSALAKRAAPVAGVDATAILASLTAREALGSTGFGEGFALPHARVHGVVRLLGFFVRLARPIDFEAIDGKPVDLAFLLVIPATAGGEHIAALAAIARRMRHADTLRDLRSARDVEAFHRRCVE